MVNKKITIGILAAITLACLALSINASAASSQKAEFPHEVWKAIQEGHEQAEVQVSKELSQIHFIDYANHATPSGNDCGPESSSYKLMRVKWKAFPITYSIDASALAQDVNGDSIVDNNDVLAAQQAVQNGIATWDAEEHPAGNIFVQSSNANVPISWAYIDGAGGTLAVTSVTYNIASKAIVRAPVTFDSGDLWNAYSQLSCTGQGNSFDIENVGTHELGHVLGLDHARKTQDSALTMWPYASQGETFKRTLGTGDKKGLDALY